MSGAWDFRMASLVPRLTSMGPGTLHCVGRVVHAKHLLPYESLGSGRSRAEGGVISLVKSPGAGSPMKLHR